MDYTIYKLTNKINNKVYIGYTNNFKRRIKEHKYIYKHQKDNLLKKAIKKYGFNNFEVEILEINADMYHAHKILEPLYIHVFNSHYKNGHGYNLTYGGDGTTGFPCSEDKKLKISLGNKGKTRTEEVKLKMSESRKGRTLSDIARKNMSEGQKKRVRPKELGDKVSKALKGRVAAWTQDPERKKEVGAKISEKNKQRDSTKHFTKCYRIFYIDGSIEEIRNLSKYAREKSYSGNELWRISKGLRRTAYKEIIKIELLNDNIVS